MAAPATRASPMRSAWRHAWSARISPARSPTTSPTSRPSARSSLPPNEPPMIRRSLIAGTGAALPARRVSNDELAAWKNIDTTDEWIVERTGIRSRYIAGDSETTGTLAAEAARKALDAAGVEPGQIGLIVLATATP